MQVFVQNESHARAGKPNARDWNFWCVMVAERDMLRSLCVKIYSQGLRSSNASLLDMSATPTRLVGVGCALSHSCTHDLSTGCSYRRQWWKNGLALRSVRLEEYVVVISGLLVSFQNVFHCQCGYMTLNEIVEQGFQVVTTFLDGEREVDIGADSVQQLFMIRAINTRDSGRHSYQI